MVIVVNTRFLLEGLLEGYGNFIFETFSRITRDHPEHRFIYLFDRPFDQKFLTAPNIEAVVAGLPARHPLLWKYWYDYTVPAVLRKYQADLFVSGDGFCSLRTRVPQCLVVHDLAFRHFPDAVRRSHLLYYKRYTPRFIQKAARIATVSAFSKSDIMAAYGTAQEKIDIVYNGVKEIFRPLSYEEKTAVKEKYTAGKEYFIYTGAIHPRKNLVNLLKAFSLFKKRQQTGMKLLLAGRLAWKFESFTQSLSRYKYRDDVVLAGYVPDEELAQLTGSAYAMVYPSLFEGFGVPVLEAMQAGVPVITSAASAMEEIAADAALYASPEQQQEIAEKMMLLYKDENLRKELISKGQLQVKNYSWERTAGLLWKCMMESGVGSL